MIYVKIPLYDWLKLQMTIAESSRKAQIHYDYTLKSEEYDEAKKQLMEHNEKLERMLNDADDVSA